MIIDSLQRFDLWIADLNLQRGTETGKIRPVVIVQSDLLNRIHDSTIICPITSKDSESTITKVKIDRLKGTGLKLISWIIVDQMRSIDNRRLVERIGQLPLENHRQLERNLGIVLNLT